MKMGKHCSLVDRLLGLRHCCCQEPFGCVLSFVSKEHNIDLTCVKVLESTQQPQVLQMKVVIEANLTDAFLPFMGPLLGHIMGPALYFGLIIMVCFSFALKKF